LREASSLGVPLTLRRQDSSNRRTRTHPDSCVGTGARAKSGTAVRSKTAQAENSGRAGRASVVSRPSKTKSAPMHVDGLIPPLRQKTSARAEAGSEKGHFYKRLPKVFQSHGFTYRQIACENYAAIYQQAWNGCPVPAVCFEVIRVKRREGFQISGRFVEPAEVIPTQNRGASTVSRSPTKTRHSQSCAC
jgi:hypothetical protein